MNRRDNTPFMFKTADLAFKKAQADSKQHVCIITQAQALRIRRQAVFMMNNLRRYFPEDSPIVKTAVNVYNNANQLADYMKAHK